MSNAGSGNEVDDNSKENSNDEDEDESNDGLISAGVREGEREFMVKGGREALTYYNWLFLNW